MSLPNILLVIADSVRADRCSCYGYPKPTTPHLDAIAAEGVRFDCAFSESSWTLPVSFTALTGLAPREHQAERTRRLPPGMPVLPEVLKRRGYATFAASANKFIGPYSGLLRGFDEAFAPPHSVELTRPFVKYVAQRLAWTDEGGQAIVSRFLQWAEGATQPWFALLWLNDAHHPYIAKRPFTSRFCSKPVSLWRQIAFSSRMRRMLDLAVTASAEDLEVMSGLYDGCVAYEDMLVGRLRAGLEAQGQWDRCATFIAADHGDMLGERRLMGHGPAADMYLPLIRIPLIVRAPQLALRDASSEALVQVADVAHTIAALADVPGSLGPTAGEAANLLDAATGAGRACAISEREPFIERRVQGAQRRSPRFDFAPHLCYMTAVVADGWRLIHRSDGRHELYHLADDPEEKLNLIDQRRDRFEELAGVVAEWQRTARPHPSTVKVPTDTDPIVDARLQALGYY
jgi:arylsulfatase A-like enzyme